MSGGVFVYDDERRWWTFEGKTVALHYQPATHEVVIKGRASDPVRDATSRRMRLWKEEGRPL